MPLSICWAAVIVANEISDVSVFITVQVYIYIFLLTDVKCQYFTSIKAKYQYITSTFTTAFLYISKHEKKYTTHRTCRMISIHQMTHSQSLLSSSAQLLVSPPVEVPAAFSVYLLFRHASFKSVRVYYRGGKKLHTLCFYWDTCYLWAHYSCACAGNASYWPASVELVICG